MKLCIQEHGIMLSDYFQGTPGVMLPLHVDSFTTKADLLQQLSEEISMVWDLIEPIAEQNEYPVDRLDFDIDWELAALEAYVRDRGRGEMDEPVAWDMEETEDEEGPVFIFSIEFDTD